MTQNTVGCYTGWGKLKKVVVGELHPIDYFDVLPESSFKERMQKLTKESIEDLLSQILETEEDDCDSCKI